MKTIVITQSNYLPWRGYFDLFRRADEVILLDSVQYTRRDWRNRNIIKTPSGPVWLTIPVEVKGRYHQSVDEAQVVDSSWVDAHRRSIERAYRKAACFDSEAPALFAMLEQVANESLLTRINEVTLRALCLRLGIATPIRRCVDLIDRDSLKAMTSSERLVQLTLAAGGTRYLSGPTARDYLDEAAFARAELEVEWMSYDGYPDYPQVRAPFDGRVSIVDLLLNTGSDAMSFIAPTAAAAPAIEGTR